MAASPINPERLIVLARELANQHTGQGRPSPTWLRRSVSTAYYALFHSITLQAAWRLLSNGSDDERHKLARTFSHQEVAKVCGWVVQQGHDGPESVAAIAVGLRNTQIVNVAASFRDLQEERHSADYDHLHEISKATALTQVAIAERAIATLAACPDQHRSAFFTLLALAANPKR